jgi:hypothetical protein
MCCLIGLSVSAAPDALAQHGTIIGIVVDSVDAPIRDADVGIRAERMLIRTDEQGRFRFDRLREGKLEVSFRRLGYEPRIVTVVVSGFAADSLLVRLAAKPVTLAGMNVSAGDYRRREGIEEFYRRRVRGIGTYIAREEIDARHSGTATDMLRNTPGLRFVQLRGGGKGVRFNSSAIARRDCMPMIWIDGQRAPGLEVDDVTLTDIEGIELYSGPSTTPMQFSQGSSHSTCGTIVIWSRPPGV